MFFTSGLEYQTLWFPSAVLKDFKVLTKVYPLYTVFLDEMPANYRMFMFLYTLMKVTARVC